MVACQPAVDHHSHPAASFSLRLTSQDIVDSLENELASTRATTNQVSQAVAQSTVLQAMVNELQRQLGVSMHSQKTAEASCLVAERQLEKLRRSSMEVSQQWFWCLVLRC